VGWGIGDDTDGSAGSGFTARINVAGNSAALEDKLYGNQLEVQNTTVSYVNSAAVTKAAVMGVTLIASTGAAVTGCRLLQNGTDKRLVQTGGTDGRLLQGGGACNIVGGTTTYPGWYGGGWQ
jgi:hypothetical protein